MLAFIRVLRVQENSDKASQKILFLYEIDCRLAIFSQLSEFDQDELWFNNRHPLTRPYRLEKKKKQLQFDQQGQHGQYVSTGDFARAY